MTNDGLFEVEYFSEFDKAVRRFVTKKKFKNANRS
jgi:hypothetical protein